MTSGHSQSDTQVTPDISGKSEWDGGAALFFIDVKVGKLFLEVLNFGQIVDHNIQILGVIVGVTLVVILRRIKRAERDDLRGNRLRKNLGAI